MRHLYDDVDLAGCLRKDPKVDGKRIVIVLSFLSSVIGLPCAYPLLNCCEQLQEIESLVSLDSVVDVYIVDCPIQGIGSCVVLSVALVASITRNYTHILLFQADKSFFISLYESRTLM